MQIDNLRKALRLKKQFAESKKNREFAESSETKTQFAESKKIMNLRKTGNRILKSFACGAGAVHPKIF